MNSKVPEKKKITVCVSLKNQFIILEVNCLKCILPSAIRSNRFIQSTFLLNEINYNYVFCCKISLFKLLEKVEINICWFQKSKNNLDSTNVWYTMLLCLWTRKSLSKPFNCPQKKKKKKKISAKQPSALHLLIKMLTWDNISFVMTWVLL